MIGSKNRKRETNRTDATLPAGVNVGPAPKSAARRKLLSGRDVTTNGGGRTAHKSRVGR
jgi:hypothetical protein